MSEDGEYVYIGLRHERVLYLWHNGSLIRISSDHYSGHDPNVNQAELSSGLEARVSPDGRHLLFAASEGLQLLSIFGGTDYNQGRCESGFPCSELYVYSAETNTLQCASCDPSGAPPRFETLVVGGVHSGGALSSEYQSNALSDDGRYVFFNSYEALVSNDTNGVLDPYVFDTTTGEFHLLSSGESDSGSFFADAAPDGKNVFFLTQQPLSRWDVDGAYDVYDARVNGGFPEPPPLPASCQGDACQPPPVQLNEMTPGSLSFSGAGNLTSTPTVHKQKRSRSKRKSRKRTRKGHQKRTVKHKRRIGR